MAKCVARPEFVAVGWGSDIYVFDRKSEKVIFSQNWNEYNKTLLAASEKESPEKSDKSEKKEAETKKGGTTEVPPNLSSAIEKEETSAQHTANQLIYLKSSIGFNATIQDLKYAANVNSFAIATNDKCVRLLSVNIDDNNVISVEIAQQRYHRKKLSCLGLSDNLIGCADKFGDIYFYRLDNLRMVRDLGHLSIVTDLLFFDQSEQRYLVSCDKDFRCRISRFPDTFAIEGFCFGHTQAVTRAAMVGNGKYLMSGSTDGTLRMWSLPYGRPLHVATFCESDGDGDSEMKDATDDDSNNGCLQQSFAVECDLSKDKTIAAEPLVVTHLLCCPTSRYIAVAFNKSSSILIFELNESKSTKEVSFDGYPNVALQLNLIQTIKRSSDTQIYDLSFDDKTSDLWVVCADKQACLEIFDNIEADTDTPFVKIDDTSNDKQLYSLVTSINSHLSQTKDGLSDIKMFYLDLIRKWDANTAKQVAHKIVGADADSVSASVATVPTTVLTDAKKDTDESYTHPPPPKKQRTDVESS